MARSQWAQRGLFISLFTFVAAATAGAQVTTADIVGKVTDSTGAVVPGAQVTVTNLGTTSQPCSPPAFPM